MSLLLCPQPNPGYGANFFGFAHSQSWGVGFRDVGLILDNTANNRWGLSFTNQSVTPTTGIYSYYPSGNTSWLTPNQWQLISVTVDCTMTVGAINFYKNGLYVGSADLTYTGTLTLGSSGYWYVGNPSPGGGDTGDGYLGLMGMARFETVVRSPSYLLSLAQSLFPNQTNW